MFLVFSRKIPATWELFRECRNAHMFLVFSRKIPAAWELFRECRNAPMFLVCSRKIPAAWEPLRRGKSVSFDSGTGQTVVYYSLFVVLQSNIAETEIWVRDCFDVSRQGYQGRQSSSIQSRWTVKSCTRPLHSRARAQRRPLSIHVFGQTDFPLPHGPTVCSRTTFGHFQSDIYRSRPQDSCILSARCNG